MDLRYHVEALREVRLLVSGAQPAHGVRVGTAIRPGDDSVQKPNRRTAGRIGGVRTGDCGRSGCDRRDQKSACRGADQRRARAAAENCAAQRRVLLRKKHDKEKNTDQFGRDHAFIPRSGGVDSEGDEIPPIKIDLDGRHIGEFVAAAMHAVRQKEATYASLSAVRSNPLGSDRKSCDGEGACVVKHPPFGGDHARGPQKWSHEAQEGKNPITGQLS